MVLWHVKYHILSHEMSAQHTTNVSICPKQHWKLELSDLSRPINAQIFLSIILSILVNALIDNLGNIFWFNRLTCRTIMNQCLFRENTIYRPGMQDDLPFLALLVHVNATHRSFNNRTHLKFLNSHIWSWTHIFGHEITYLVMISHIWSWNHIFGHEITYLVMKSHIWS